MVPGSAWVTGANEPGRHAIDVVCGRDFTPDGTVEAEFEGERQRIESMIDWCRKGPALAEVEHVEVAWVEPRAESGFTVSGGWA